MRDVAALDQTSLRLHLFCCAPGWSCSEHVHIVIRCSLFTLDDKAQRVAPQATRNEQCRQYDLLRLSTIGHILRNPRFETSANSWWAFKVQDRKVQKLPDRVKFPQYSLETSAAARRGCKVDHLLKAPESITNPDYSIACNVRQ